MIELLTIVVIIGIAAGMAVPRFQIAIERIKYNAANKRLMTTLQLARSYAVANESPYGVYFNGTLNNGNQGSALNYTLFKDTNNPGKYRYDTGDSVMRVDTMTSAVTYLATDLADEVIIFLPNGSAQFTGGGNIVTLAYTSDISAAFEAKVLPSTGRIKTLFETYY